MAINGQENINIGLPNESQNSDSLYTAFSKTQNNFNTLFAYASPYGNFVGGNGINTSLDEANGVVTITNTGVTSIIPGTNIGITTHPNGAVEIASNGGGNGGGGTVTSVGVVGASGNARIVPSGTNPIVGSGTIVLDLATTGVVPGTYTYPTVTVDDFGRVNYISNGNSVGTVTNVGVIPGPGIQVTGSPITTSGDITVTNTGVVRINAGEGLTVSDNTGNVTIAVAQGIGTVTSIEVVSSTLNISGSPIVDSGSIIIDLPSNIANLDQLFGGISITNNTVITTSTPNETITIAAGDYVTPGWVSIYGDVGDEITSEYGEGIAFDKEGNLYMVGGDGTNGIYTALVKYDTQGNIVWQKAFTLGVAYKSAECVTLDSAGNIYVGLVDQDSHDGYIVKLDPTGETILWQKSLVPASGNVSWMGNMAVDSNDNVYLVVNLATNRIIFRFNSIGTQVLQLETENTGGYGVGVDQGGNIYAGDDVLTKFNSSGAVVYQVYPFDNTWSLYDTVTDSTGNSYVVGGKVGALGIQKIDRNGNSVWQSTIDLSSIGSLSARLYSVTLDPDNGTVYVAGTATFSGNDDLVVGSLNPITGSLNWLNRFGSSESETMWYWYGTQVITAFNGRLGITGYQTASGTSATNAITVQLPANGGGLGVSGIYTYQSLDVTPIVITGSTSEAAETNMLGSFTVSAGLMSLQNNIYTSDLTVLPNGLSNFVFAPSGGLTFPDGTTQSTAYSSSSANVFNNITANSITLSNTAVRLGTAAGTTNSGTDTVAIGHYAGQTNQGAYAVAIGSSASSFDQGPGAVAIGVSAAGATMYDHGQGMYSIAIGARAGLQNQNTYAVAVGANAGQYTQGNYSVAVGSYAASSLQGTFSVATGYYAGGSSQGANAVAVGAQAGSTSQGDYSIAVGTQAGMTSQGKSAVALGVYAGYTNQSNYAVASGYSAGMTTQGANAVAVGEQAGMTTQGSRAVAIGSHAGVYQQSAHAVAVGPDAGWTSQGLQAIAIGRAAGNNSQGSASIAIGVEAGNTSQKANAIAIGFAAGWSNQGNGAVALGGYAGQQSQGLNSIAIGNNAGTTNMANNTIILNATGSALENTTANTCVIKPVRRVTSVPAGFYAAYYNPTTGELVYLQP